MKIARQNERVLAKASRHARWNNDLKGYLAAQNAGYMYRGIENVDDKNLRYFQAANQRRFYGDSGVGGQQPAGDTQRPAEGAQQPAGEQQQPPAEGRISSPTPSLVTSSGGGQLPAGSIQPPIGGTQPLGGGTQLPNVGTPKKPKSFFEERASGRQDFVDTIRNQRSGEEGVTDKFAEQARKQGAALGLTSEQIQATLDGETELSPEAIAGRAKSKKDAAAKEAYQKEFGESDAKWAERIKGLPADQKAMLEGLTPQQKKDSLTKGIENAKTKIDSAKTKGDKAGKEIQDSLNRIDGYMEKADDARAIREGYKDAKAKRLAEKPMMVGGKEVGKATPEEQRIWVEENKKAKDNASLLSSNNPLGSISFPSIDSIQTSVAPLEIATKSTNDKFLESRNVGISLPKEELEARSNQLYVDLSNEQNQKERDSYSMEGFGGSLIESIAKGFRSNKWSDDTKEEKIARQKRIKQAQEAGLTPTPPQPDRVKTDELFSSLDKSQSRATLMSRPLMS